MDFDKVSGEWQRRGFSCAIWTDPPGQVWAGFVHDTDELVMLAQGEIEISFNGQSWRPATGEEILIPRGARHTVRNTGNTVNRWYYGYRRR